MKDDDFELKLLSLDWWVCDGYYKTIYKYFTIKVAYKRMEELERKHDIKANKFVGG